MAGTAWLVDGDRFASKIKSSGSSAPERVKFNSNPTKSCPNCHHTIDNSDVSQVWPGLPRGVKFDPSDSEIILHLLGKAGIGDPPHAFINEFIPTLDCDDGICYTHPQRLPGVKQDGSFSHFFHKAIKAYSTGTRKRRKIHGDDLGDVRWHKTGRTKPVFLDGIQKGCKKIMVLYTSTGKGGKPEKTNWVMHQYHLGTDEDEKDGEFVVSKVFYQQQQGKVGDKNEDDIREAFDDVVPKVDPVTPKSVTPQPPRAERRISNFCSEQATGTSSVDPPVQVPAVEDAEEVLQIECEMPGQGDHLKAENLGDQMVDHDGNRAEEDPKWWENESQYLLDSQQLVEGLSLCDELLQSQSPNRDGNGIDRALNGKPCLSDYAHLGPENLKKDLEECQNLNLDPANIELNTPPDIRLSQLEFESQESYLAWGGGHVTD